MGGWVVVIAVGCGGGRAHVDAAVDDAIDDAPINADFFYHEVALIPVVVHRDVDLLFVIDDAPGTAETQLDLRNGFPELVKS